MQINNQAASQQNRVADDGGQEASATIPPGKLSSIKLLFPFLRKNITIFSTRPAPSYFSPFLEKIFTYFFCQALYSINQKSSDLKKWESLGQAPKLGTAYEWVCFALKHKATFVIIVNCRVDKYIFKYEPLYVARAETPQFDERFIGFGMTRNTQVQFWLNKALQSVQPWELKSNVWRKTIVVTEFKSCSMFRSIKDYSFLFVLYSLKVVNYMPDACAWFF